MNLPKSATLAALEDSKPDIDRRASLTKGVGVVESVEGLTVPELTVFNDYVAVLLCKRKSEIVLTGSSEYSNIGVIVGFGGNCVNKFVLSQQILFNGKGGAAICKFEGLPPEYVNDNGEEREVVMVQERNIFYVSIGEEAVTVVGKDATKYCCGKQVTECCGDRSCLK